MDNGWQLPVHRTNILLIEDPQFAGDKIDEFLKNEKLKSSSFDEAYDPADYSFLKKPELHSLNGIIEQLRLELKELANNSLEIDDLEER